MSVERIKNMDAIGEEEEEEEEEGFWPDYCTYRISKARDSPCAAESSCPWQLSERSLWDLEGGEERGGGGSLRVDR
jgi:hypothetical protein